MKVIDGGTLVNDKWDILKIGLLNIGTNTDYFKCNINETIYLKKTLINLIHNETIVLIYKI